MPNDYAPENREGFDLSGMAETALKLQPGLDLEETPGDAAARQAAAAEAEAQKAVEDEARGEETAEQKESREAEEARVAAEEKTGEETAEEKVAREADEQRAAEAETAEEKTAREAKEAEDAAKAEAAKKEDPDSDLIQKAREVEPHTSKKTRATIEFFRAEAKKARELARTEAATRAKAEKDLADAAEKAKTAVAPKELTEELTRLRATVQELDATRDPEIVAKFDRPIEQNTNSVIEILKGFNYDKNEDGTPAPNAIPNLLKAGLTLNNPEVKRILEAMDKNDASDEAQTIRDVISDNRRLSRDKVAAIESIKGQVGERAAARAQQQQASAQDFDRQTIAQAGPILNTELEALKKDFSYMVRPAEPVSTDTAEVATMKRSQIAEFDRAEEQIRNLAVSFSTNDKKGPDAIKARASMAAHAILAATLKVRVIPKLKAENKALAAKVATLEAAAAKAKKAVDLTRAHGAAAGGTARPAAEISKSLPTNDAFAEFAKSQGVSVDS